MDVRVIKENVPVYPVSAANFLASGDNMKKLNANRDGKSLLLIGWDSKF